MHSRSLRLVLAFSLLVPSAAIAVPFPLLRQLSTSGRGPSHISATQLDDASEEELALHRAERLANMTPEQLKKREIAYAKRLVARAPRGRGFRSERKNAKLGKGFANKGTGLNFDRRPKAKATCACGSGLSYGECCSVYHEALACDAPEPSALVRARYTAFCYRLPDFLIATTDPEGEEFMEEVSSWKKQLLKLCDEMDFQGLQLINSETTGSPPTVEFRASFVPKGTLNLTDLCEKSEFVQRDGKWLYSCGKTRYESPKA